MGYHSTLKGNEALIRASMWMTFGKMLSKRSKSQKTTYCIIPYIKNVQNRQIYRDKVDEWLPGAEGWGLG